MNRVLDNGRGVGGRVGGGSSAADDNILNSIISIFGGNNRDRVDFGGVGNWVVDNWQLSIIGLLAIFVLIRR